MDPVLQMFLTLTEKSLNSKNIWLPKNERTQIAEKARHLFTNEDYHSEVNAVEDAIASQDDENKLHDFQIKLSYHGGILSVDYQDGSDTEYYEQESVDEILEQLSMILDELLTQKDHHLAND